MPAQLPVGEYTLLSDPVVAEAVRIAFAPLLGAMVSAEDIEAFLLRAFQCQALTSTHSSAG